MPKSRRRAVIDAIYEAFTMFDDFDPNAKRRDIGEREVLLEKFAQYLEEKFESHMPDNLKPLLNKRWIQEELDYILDSDNESLDAPTRAKLAALFLLSLACES